MQRAALILALVAAGCGSHASGGGDLGGGGSGGSGGDGGATPPPCMCPADQLCDNGACVAIPAGALVVDATGGRHPINPQIYGLAFASPATLKALNVPLDRWGGNGATLYNWRTNLSNHANDYFFENIPGQSADQFISDNTGAGAATLMTIPTIGWTPKASSPTTHPYACGFPTEVYGAQQMTDPYDAHCGNGKDPTGKLLVGNPSNDAEQATPAFEAQWVQHLGGGVTLFQLDNEMMLWPSTHRDVRATPVSTDDVVNATLAYAPVIKANNANAYVLGYTAWYALDLFVSGLDTANNNSADQMAHGNIPLAQWYLRQLAAYEQQHGQRLVDCLDFHYYPQGGDPLENTRSLWDPTYHDPSWFNDFKNEPMQLLPRIAGWIAAEYPGTAICVSEYNWNNDDPTNPVAGLAEADVLGIFGKYGVRLAAFWTTPVDGAGMPRPAYRAFELYRNADGAGHGFGDTSVSAASPLAKAAIYAAVDSPTGALTVIVINKDTAALSVPLVVEHFAAGASAKVYQAVAGTGALTTPPSLAVTGGQLMLSLPAQSMQLIVIPPA